LTAAQVGGSFGSLVGFGIEMMEHMKEVNFLEGAGETHDFLENMAQIHLSRKGVGDHSLD
jgi:hypothetical protein